jgi:hypothetical protein
MGYRFWVESNRGKEVVENQPNGWSTPEWEVFIFLGAAGTDEPHLRPQVGESRKGGSSGPPQRRATKKRARAAAAGEGHETGEVVDDAEATTGFETPPLGGTGSGTGPVRTGSEMNLRLPTSDSEARLLNNVEEMKEGMRETITILREMVSIDRSRVDLETSRVQLSSIKVQLASFPVGSAAHTRALEHLEKYASGK